MRAVIIGNGLINDYSYIKSKITTDDFIICADGGMSHAERLGISVDIAIGDFDSSEKQNGISTYEFPKDKDYTDGELAVNYAIENGYTDVLLLGMTGHRLDHTLTNMFQLLKSGNISLIDDKNEIFALKDGITLKGYKGKTISVIPVYGDLEGVCETGVYYPLSDETLHFGEGRGNSNIITDDICTITAQSGMGLIFINDGE